MVMLRGASFTAPEVTPTGLSVSPETSDVRYICHCALDASGLSRVDFFIDKDTNQIYFNEINTLPGFTPISMFPKMCQEAGLDFEELTNLLINEAVLRYNARAKLQTSR